MAKLAVERGAPHVYLHAFLDGRDMPPKSAGPSLQKMDEVFAELGRGRIATIVGRRHFAPACGTARLGHGPFDHRSRSSGPAMARRRCSSEAVAVATAPAGQGTCEQGSSWTVAFATVEAAVRKAAHYFQCAQDTGHAMYIKKAQDRDRAAQAEKWFVQMAAAAGAKDGARLVKLYGEKKKICSLCHEY